MPEPRAVAVTGPSSTPTVAQTRELLALLKGAGSVHHGCCEGADEAAHHIAERLRIRIVGHPGCTRGGRAKKRAKLREWEFWCLHRPEWFLDRNEAIVRECTELVALVGREDTWPYRSGEWHAINAAVRAGKPVTLVLPSGRRASP